jgi:hypothetical protein
LNKFIGMSSVFVHPITTVESSTCRHSVTVMFSHCYPNRYLVGIFNFIRNWTLNAVVADCQQCERGQTDNEIGKLLYTCYLGYRRWLLNKTWIECRKACDYRVADSCVKAHQLWHPLLLSQRYTPTTNFTFDTTVTFVTNPGSATLRRKPKIMRSTPLCGGYSTLSPETSNQERQIPSLLSLRLRCRGQAHCSIPTTCNNPTAWYHTTESFHRPDSSLYKLRIGTTGFLLGSWTLSMGPIGCPEISVRNYHYMLRDSSEGRSSHLLGDWNLK